MIGAPGTPSPLGPFLSMTMSLEADCTARTFWACRFAPEHSRRPTAAHPSSQSTERTGPASSTALIRTDAFASPMTSSPNSRTCCRRERQCRSSRRNHCCQPKSLSDETPSGTVPHPNRLVCYATALSSCDLKRISDTGVTVPSSQLGCSVLLRAGEENRTPIISLEG